MSAEPGWYPDPRDGSAAVRWWDGTCWTGWLDDSADAPPPSTSDANDQASWAPPEEHAAPVAAASAVRLPVAVAATVAALVLALLAVGATVSATSQAVVSGPAVAPPSPSGPPAVTYEEATRTARAAGLSIVLPAEPWNCSTTAKKIDKYFSNAIACSVVTHAKVNGKDDSYANVVIGVVDPSLVQVSPQTTAESVFRQVQTNLFRSTTTLSDNTSGPAGIGPAESVWRFEGRLSYTNKVLGQRYDQVQVVVADAGPGQFVAMIFNLIDDAPAPIKKTLDASVTTLDYR